MFTIKQIKYFVMTVEQGSVSAAAELLDMTPQAVSKGINEIEQNLNRPLFVRKASGLKPTPFGYALYQKARKALSGINELELYAQGAQLDNRSEMEMLLCVPKFASFNAVRSHITSFIRKGTGLSVHVRRGSLEACCDELTVGSIDAFVTIGKTNLQEFEVNKIDSTSVGALMTRRHPYVTKRNLSCADFVETPLYLIPPFCFFYETVIESFEQFTADGPSMNLKHLDMSLMGIYRALMRDKGCVVVPNIHGLDELFPDTVVVPFDVEEVPRVPLCLVTHKTMKSPYCIALEQLVVERPQQHFEVEEVFD